MMVAEKPSICNSIAIALSGGLEFCNSHGKTPPVHEFTGTFQNKKVMYRVTSVTGHVFSTDFPKEYQDWEATAPADLFSAPVLSIPTRGSIVSLLKNEGRGINIMVRLRSRRREHLFRSHTMCEIRHVAKKWTTNLSS